MNQATRGVFCGLFLGSCLAASVAAPVHATMSDRFAYKLKMIQEADQADPAIEKRMTAEFASCQEHAVTTRDNVACFDTEFARQDGVLNRVWKTTLRRLPAATRLRLVASQREWIAARDPFCKSNAESEGGGGSITPVIYVDCRVEETIRRAMWLDALR